MRIANGAVRTIIAAAAMALAAGLAQAADDEGKIAQVDAEALTITLENGNTYKLSAEFDVEAALHAVRPICEDVRDRGAEALYAAAERFDGVRPPRLRVPAVVIAAALDGLEPVVREALEESIRRARLVHADQRRTDTTTTVASGGTVSRAEEHSQLRREESAGAIDPVTEDAVAFTSSRPATSSSSSEQAITRSLAPAAHRATRTLVPDTSSSRWSRGCTRTTRCWSRRARTQARLRGSDENENGPFRSPSTAASGGMSGAVMTRVVPSRRAE
mgnify:CR=1 FL=1